MSFVALLRFNSKLGLQLRMMVFRHGVLPMSK